jgi:hypothetical protein
MKIEIATSMDELDLTKWDTRRIAYLAAAVSVVVSVLLSIHLIYKHLRNYTKPTLQRYIVRIILMVPVRQPAALCVAYSAYLFNFQYNSNIFIDILITEQESRNLFFIYLFIIIHRRRRDVCVRWPDLFTVQLVLPDVPRPRQHN